MKTDLGKFMLIMYYLQMIFVYLKITEDKLQSTIFTMNKILKGYNFKISKNKKK